MTIPRQCSGELYTFLEVGKTASNTEIKKSYHKLALKLHPDKTGGHTTEEFKRIVEANDILSDPDQRKLYDTIGRSGMSKLGAYGMDSTMASFVSHPHAIRGVIFVTWLFAALLLIFLVLINVNIDFKRGWPWGVVFIPLWIIFVPFFPITVSVIVSGFRQRCFLAIFGALQGLLTMAALCCLASSLDGRLSWKVTFGAIFVAYIISTIRTIFNLHLSKFKEQLVADGFQAADSVTYSSPIYIKHVASSILVSILVIIFIILMAMRVVLDDHKNMNFYIIFSPIFTCFSLPIIFMVVELLICPSLSMNETTGSKVKTIIQLLVIFALQVYMFVMVAIKCQRELNDGLRGPSASVCTIPLYILFGSAVLMLSCACTYSLVGPASEMDVDSGQNGNTTEYAACTENGQVTPDSNKYKSVTEIDN